MTQITDWIDTVSQKVGAGVDETLIERYVLNALIEFCQESHVYTATLYRNSVANKAVYDVDLPIDTVLEEVTAVSYKGVPLDLKTEAQAYHENENWKTAPGVPNIYVQWEEDSIRLSPVPVDTGHSMLIEISVRPAEGVTEVDNMFWRKYKEVIANLAAAHLLLIPKSSERPWGDANAASTYMALYEQRLSQLLSMGAKTQQARGVRRAKPGPII